MLSMMPEELRTLIDFLFLFLKTLIMQKLNRRTISLMLVKIAPRVFVGDRQRDRMLAKLTFGDLRVTSVIFGWPS